MKKAGQDPVFETIDDEAGVIKLAGRGAPLDVVEEFGVEAARDLALDRTTRLALGAGLDALRDAGIPLVMRYRSTTLGTMLPEKWGLPESMRDDTGVIFASAFPGYGEFADDIEKYMTDRGRREQLLALEAVRARMTGVRAGRGRGRPSHRRAAPPARGRALRVRPPVHLPLPGDGALAVRRADRRPRAEHPDQRRLREHDPGRLPGRGLDPHRPLPPRRRRVR